MKRYATIAGKIRHINGWKKNRPNGDQHRTFQMPVGVTLPTNTKMPFWVAIRNQGNIGDCTANGTLECEGFLYMLTGRPDPVFSRFARYAWTRQIEGTPLTEDSGCEVQNAIKCGEVKGSCLESTWPMIDDGHQFTIDPTPECVTEASSRKTLFTYRLPTLRTIKACLAQGFPLVIGFTVPEEMESAAVAASGDLPVPTGKTVFIGGHLVPIIGYDDDKRRLLFPNSWGPDWGNKGYGTMPYEFVTDSYAEDATTIRKLEIIQ